MTDLLYTTGYRVNRIFSAAVSLAAAAACAPLFKKAGLNEAAGFNAVPLAAVAVFLLLNLYLTRKYRRRKKILQAPFPDEWERILDEKVRFYRLLGEDEQYMFRKRVQIFLSEVRVTGIESTVDDEIRVLTGASAVIPVFGLPDWEYRGLDEILVYPASFDDEFNIKGKGRDILGMTQENTSCVIISAKALKEGFKRNDGHNAALHEFLHRIDGGDGSMDGMPALFLTKDEIAQWKKIVEDEMELLVKNRSDMDPYALTDRSEFFAAAGEYFFEKPGRMKERHPSLYSIMCKMFKQDPASVILDETTGSVTPAKKR